MVFGRRKFFILLVTVAAAVLLSADPTFAQEFDGAIGGVRSLYVSMGNLLKIALGIGAMVVLVMIILRIIRGDKESAAKLGWWLIGLAFGYVMIAVLEGLENLA